MISSFFIAIGAFIFTLLQAITPASTSLPSGITSALTYVGVAVNSVSFIIPVDSLFTALGIVIGYEGIMWLFHGTLWVWKKIPIIGR